MVPAGTSRSLTYTSTKPSSFVQSQRTFGGEYDVFVETLGASQNDILEALQEPANQVVEAVLNVLERTPPELSADIIENGAVLTGGGSLLNGFKELLEAELKIPIFLAESPLTSVAEGTGILLDNLYMLERQ